jgi:small-conductance mechanosensitive channel
VLALRTAIAALVLVAAAPAAAARKPKPGPSASAPVPSASAPASAEAPALDSGFDAAPPASASAAPAPPPASVSAVPAVPAPAPAPPPAAPPASARLPPAAAPPATAPVKGAPVKLHDAVVFTVRAPHGPQSAEQRARAATEALDSAAESASADDVRFEQRADVAVIYAGKAPVIQLYPEDVRAAGDSSLDVHAAAVTAGIKDAMREEQKRSAIARRVLSFALVVLSGLIALWIVRKIGDWAGRARNFITDNPDRIPAIRPLSLEVVRPQTLRTGLLLTLGVGRWLLQFLIVYLWIVLALSLFASTRAYTERLTGFVFSPVTALMGRLAASLPVLFVAAMAAIAVAILVRFIGLFFAGIDRGQTSVNWLPRDLARPTSVLLQIAVILGALVFGAPVVTGDSEGALGRVGTVALAALALASTPLLATALVGVSVVYLRRLRPGEFAEVGDHTGRVLDVGLLDIRLEDAHGCQVRIPHLSWLHKPVRLLGPAPRVSVEISGPSSAPAVREQLQQTAREHGENATVELIAIEGDSVRYRISITSGLPDARGQLLASVNDVLAASKAPPPARPPPPAPRRNVVP